MVSLRAPLILRAHGALQTCATSLTAGAPAARSKTRTAAARRPPAAHAAVRPPGATRIIAVPSQRRTFSSSGNKNGPLWYDEAQCAEKTPEQSALVVRYPFALSSQLRREYVRFDGGVRLGLLLEDMDSACGDVAERHCYHGNGVSYRCDNVTGLVDDIEVFSIPDIVDNNDKTQSSGLDMVLEGRMIWTGRSSMLIRISLWGIDPSWKADPALCGKPDPDDSVPKLDLAHAKGGNTGHSQKRVYRIGDLASDLPDGELEAKVGVLGRIGLQYTGRGTEGALDAILPPEGQRKMLMRANFLFVGLQPSTRKAVQINPLRIERKPNSGAECAASQLFAEGERRKEERRRKTAASLDHVQPRENEVEYLHELYLRTQASGVNALSGSNADMFDYAAIFSQSVGGSAVSASAGGSSDVNRSFSRSDSGRNLVGLTATGTTGGAESSGTLCVPINNTQLRTSVFTHPQEQNSGGKIFGGQLMRQAFELAYQNISLFHASSTCVEWAPGTESPEPVSVRAHVSPVHMTDITFLRPVVIGSSIRFSSYIVYTKREYAQVVVEAEIYDFNTRVKHASNQFGFTFKRTSGEHFPFVLPQTYADMMLSLQGRRVLKDFLKKSGGQ